MWCGRRRCGCGQKGQRRSWHGTRRRGRRTSASSRVESGSIRCVRGWRRRRPRSANNWTRRRPGWARRRRWHAAWWRRRRRPGRWRGSDWSGCSNPHEDLLPRSTPAHFPTPRRLPLARVNDAFALIEGRATMGKVVLEP
eukprot:scaffold58498_cov60-Phaeocystis_antarctica.AAC.1